jgi:serine/threonine protein kinase
MSAHGGGGGGGGAAVVQPTLPAPRLTKGKYTLTDFSIQRTLGTGSFGRVHLVQSKHNQRFYAVKVLKKQQVVRMKQVEHTNDERRMLQKVKHPFLITLWGTFQDSKNLYMVMDFVEGGELFSLLRKSQVRPLLPRRRPPRRAPAHPPTSAFPTPWPSSTRPRSPSRWTTCTDSTSSTAT